MPTAKKELALEHDNVADFLNRKIEASSKNQREIANEIGYEKPNILSMMKRGESKVPLDRIPAIARALDVDMGHLFRLALKQYWPDIHLVVHEIFGNTVSENEIEIVRYIREQSHNMDPKMSDRTRSLLAEAFKPH